MASSQCRSGQHDDCSGYVGPLDTYVCRCSCHEYGADGRRRLGTDTTRCHNAGSLIF